MSMMRRRRISESRFMRIRIHQRINMNATVDFLKTLHELQRTSEFKSMKIRISSKNDILQCYCCRETKSHFSMTHETALIRSHLQNS